MPKPLKWNPAVRGHGEVTARSGFRAFVQPAGSGKWRWEVKPVGYEMIDPMRSVGAGTASSKTAAKTAAARLLLAQLDPLKADLEKEFLAGAPMPVFGKGSHATKKSPGQLQREIDEALVSKGKTKTAEDLEKALADRLGFVPTEDFILRAQGEWEGFTLDSLRSEERKMTREFEKRGGRGPDLADRIDEARTALALVDSGFLKGDRLGILRLTDRDRPKLKSDFDY
jgi:hypothetical protein